MTVRTDENFAPFKLAEDSDNGSLIVSMQVLGPRDPVAAKAQLFGNVEDTYGNFFFQSYELEQHADDVWLGHVEYGPRRVPEPGVAEWNFSIRTERQHITQAVEEVSRYPSTAADMKGAINATRDGVKGTDIPVAKLTWGEKHYIPAADFNASYLDALHQTVGKSNENPFRIWTEEEVLLLGVDGEPYSTEIVALTFQFTATPSVTGVTIGDIEGIQKKGQHLLWVYYMDAVDPTTKFIYQKPVAVYIDQIVETADYDLLGLPDPFNPES